MIKSKNGQYWLRSGYQTAYFGIFIVAIYKFISSVSSSNDPMKSNSEPITNQLSQNGYSDLWILNIFYYPMTIFVYVFAVHLLRIYYTLEEMEDSEGRYQNFYDSYSELGRKVEFVIRTLIVGLISLKAISVNRYDELAFFLILFYGLLLAWSALALLQKKGWKESFFVSSIAGLFFAFFMTRINYDDGSWQWGVILVYIAAIALTVDLGLYLLNEIRMFFKKEEKNAIVNIWNKIVYPW